MGRDQARDVKCKCESKCESKCKDKSVKGNLKVKKCVNICKNLTVKGDVKIEGKLMVRDQMAPKNIFIVGPSSAETGNLVAYYPLKNEEFVPVNDKIRKYVNLFNGAESALGPLNRHSEGLAMPDFISKKIGYNLVNSNEITKTPHGNYHIINYAVSGATAIGNNWNVPNGIPETWATTTGPHGYDSQVALLLSHLNSACKSPSENDIVIYNGVGGNDIGAIALTNIIDGPAAAAAAIGQFLNTHITNIQALYNAGFRHVYMDYFGSEVLDYSPILIKLDVANPGTLAALKGLSDVLFLGPTGLLQLLANQAYVTMPELHLSYNDLSAYGNDVAASPSLYGFRLPMITDPDPRVPPSQFPQFPFPTLLNILAINPNRNDYNLGFIDDFHFTQLGQERFADYISKFFLPW
jgi:hypothetical protein